MRILLTGATGFLGNNLLRMLQQPTYQVSCLVRQTADPRPLQGLTFDPIYADLAAPETFTQHVGDFDVLIHCAAMIHIGWTRFDESRAVNVTATQRLAEFCRLHDRRMVLVSSVDTLAYSANGQPVSERQREPRKPSSAYVVSKTEAEQEVIAQIARGLDAIIVHPGFMVGPWDWKPSSGQMMLSIARGFAPLAPAGGCSAVDVRDVAEGVIAAARQGQSGEHYILAGHNLSYLDLWRAMAQTIGKRGPRRKLPHWLASAAGLAGDLWTRLTRREPLINSAATAQGQLLQYYSSQKAIDELGYAVGPIDIALEDAWTWFRAYGYVNARRAMREPPNSGEPRR